MGDIEAVLRAIWDKYEPQRQAERNAAETAHAAAAELRELNERRIRQGLPSVSEPQVTGTTQQYWQGTWPLPKTWRDEMDADLLAAIRRHFQ